MTFTFLRCALFHIFLISSQVFQRFEWFTTTWATHCSTCVLTVDKYRKGVFFSKFTWNWDDRIINDWAWCCIQRHSVHRDCIHWLQLINIPWLKAFADICMGLTYCNPNAWFVVIIIGNWSDGNWTFGNDAVVTGNCMNGSCIVTTGACVASETIPIDWLNCTDCPNSGIPWKTCVDDWFICIWRTICVETIKGPDDCSLGDIDWLLSGWRIHIFHIVVLVLDSIFVM